VEADQPLADVMTDKATVEVPSPVAGKVIAAHGKAGDKLAVGSELLRLETAAAGAAEGGEHAFGRPRESGDPATFVGDPWIPACAGMTSLVPC
jgi:2-oxoisovalerate dehydrogenase E2 component (dihydrolipoyl transacylase)